jgi:hypothetical protein
VDEKQLDEARGFLRKAGESLKSEELETLTRIVPG